jgi:hypothetical protein
MDDAKSVGIFLADEADICAGTEAEAAPKSSRSARHSETIQTTLITPRYNYASNKYQDMWAGWDAKQSSS